MDNFSKQEIGRRIDERMTELGISNADLARQVGLSKVAVGKCLKG